MAKFTAELSIEEKARLYDEIIAKRSESAKKSNANRSSEKRKESAKKAIQARWAKRNDK